MWNMLNNGVCPPEEPSPLQFVRIASGYYVNMAIDSLGRLYAWGSSSYSYQGQTPVAVPATSNFTQHPATFRALPYYASMVYPYQIEYSKTDWVDCQTVEYISMALDSEGYLYAVGEDGGGGSVYGRGGWPVTSQYNLTSGVFYLGGEQAIVMIPVNNHQWSKFVLGQYHVIAQKPDKSLWIWGKNLANATYGSLSYATDFISLTPIQMTWVPGPVKLFDAGYSVTAVVTESNEIYAWGDWSNDTIGLKTTPYLVPFTLPIGQNIVDIKCNYSGIIILLSNGSVYGIGWRIGFVDPPLEATVFTLAPGEHNFVKIWCALEAGAAALDINGVLWAWGNQSFLIVQGGVDDITSTNPVFTSGADPSIYRWVDFAPGSWSYLAINDEGRLFSWGTAVYGLQGIGLFEDDPEAIDLYSAVECGPYATLEGGINAYEAYVPGGPTAALQIVIPSPVQLAEHNPCGHWHKVNSNKSVADSAAEIPSCCWSFAVDIQGADIVLYGLGIKPTCPVIALRYNISTRSWYGPYARIDNFFAAQHLAGASIDGHLDAVMMYGGDGNQISASNHRVIISATHHVSLGGTQETEFTGVPAQSCEGRIVVQEAFGIVAILLQTFTALELWSTATFGGVFYLQNTWPIATGFRGARLVRDGNTFYVGILHATGPIKLYKATTLNVWTPCTDIPTLPEAKSFNMWTSTGTLFTLVHNRFFFSVNNGVTHTERIIPNITNFGISNGATKSSTMFYPDKLQKTLDYTVSSPAWIDLPIIENIGDIGYTLDSSTTVRNSGDFGVYMKDNLFVISRIVMPITQNLGETWENVQTPLIYFNSSEAAFVGEDDPRWKFVKQGDKKKLDPQYA